jgi:hypothetical protein
MAMNLIQALGRLRQEDGKFEASLRYSARPCLKTLLKKTKQNKTVEAFLKVR